MTGPAETFSSQADAESWIGQSWRELAAAGVTTVVLVEDDRVEYRMSLLPAERVSYQPSRPCGVPRGARSGPARSSSASSR